MRNRELTTLRAISGAYLGKTNTLIRAFEYLEQNPRLSTLRYLCLNLGVNVSRQFVLSANLCGEAGGDFKHPIYFSI